MRDDFPPPSGLPAGIRVVNSTTNSNIAAVAASLHLKAAQPPIGPKERTVDVTGASKEVVELIETVLLLTEQRSQIADEYGNPIDVGMDKTIPEALDWLVSVYCPELELVPIDPERALKDCIKLRQELEVDGRG